MAVEFGRSGQNRRLVVEVLEKTFHVKRFSVQGNETRTVLSELVGPFSGGVEYSQDFDRIAAHAVRQDERSPGDYQFAGARNPSDAAGGRMAG
jgi:hypothetical protein